MRPEIAGHWSCACWLALCKFTEIISAVHCRRSHDCGDFFEHGRPYRNSQGARPPRREVTYRAMGLVKTRRKATACQQTKVAGASTKGSPGRSNHRRLKFTLPTTKKHHKGSCLLPGLVKRAATENISGRNIGARHGTSGNGPPDTYKDHVSRYQEDLRRQLMYIAPSEIRRDCEAT